MLNINDHNDQGCTVIELASVSSAQELIPSALSPETALNETEGNKETYDLMVLLLARPSQMSYGPAVAESNELSALVRKARVRDSPGVTLPCMLMTPGACKIRRGCNVLQVPIQIIPLGVPKRGTHTRD